MSGMPSALAAPAMTMAPEMARLRASALGWLATMEAPGGPGRYKLHAAAEPTVFASCFAVFLRRLLNDLDGLTPAARAAWLASLQDYQDPVSGLFVDPSNAARASDALHDARHLDMQLTTFALGAVHGLGGAPRHRLAFLDEWTPAAVDRWLGTLDWHEAWNSGNKAMFLGICLAYESERDARHRQALDAWFDWHDRHQNPQTGFWGRGVKARFIDGLGGSYHQFTVYNYARRPIAHARHIVDRTLMIQCPDGLYSPYMGGATCYELDAADVLVHMYRQHDYRRDEIRAALARMLPGVLSMQNSDGGFCWGRWRRPRAGEVAAVAAAVARHHSPGYLYYSLRALAAPVVRPMPVLRVGWAREPRGYEDSSVFDTWFRIVTIAEIATVLTTLPYAQFPWQFLTVPGLGWFPAGSPSV